MIGMRENAFWAKRFPAGSKFELERRPRFRVGKWKATTRRNMLCKTVQLAFANTQQNVGISLSKPARKRKLY